MNRRAAKLAACALAAFSVLWSGGAYAQSLPANDYSRVFELLTNQERRLTAQERELQEQQRLLEEQQALIDRQRAQIESLTRRSAADREIQGPELETFRGQGAIQSGLSYGELDPDEPLFANRRAPIRTLMQTEGGSAPQPTPAAAPQGPVGEAPPEETQVSTVEALPEGQNALLGRGRLVIEPSIEYSRSSGDRFIFRGVAVTTGINIGLIEANDTARDTVAASVAVRYALTDRLEVEARAPFMYRHDRVTTLATGSTTTMRTYELDGAEIGDAEISARYQLNNGRNGAPIFVASARVKSDTGLGPFDVDRDAQGVATELATGSGFWGVQGGLSVLYPTDPAVLFGNIAYLHNIGDDIDRSFGQAIIGHVDPGDSISLGFGFGFAMNPRFSYSLSYSHSYVRPTETEISDANGVMVNQESPELHVGAMQLGLSFRATERLTIATAVDIGVTEDAPDVRISLRTPFRW
ncbi:MAG: transporter [Hyphomonadaceae bacterium]